MKLQVSALSFYPWHWIMYMIMSLKSELVVNVTCNGCFTTFNGWF